MSDGEVLAELERLGTVQNRKVYARHGVGPEMFGVSFANLARLRRRLKTNHALAERLWASGNHDARMLAAMIADPARATSRQLDAWSRQLDNYIVTNAFTRLVAHSRFAARKAEVWTRARREFVAAAGWGLVSDLSAFGTGLADALFRAYLARIEREIHSRPNRVRYSMNSALIAIGCRNPALRDAALRVARRIGKVEVDHGETGCRTPDAVMYIGKAWGHAHSAKAGGSARRKRKQVNQRR